MLSLLQQAVVAVLSVYLSLTNNLAHELTNLFDLPGDVATVSATEPSNQSPLQRLSSSYSAAIPRILIENAAYQQAAVASGWNDATTSSPIEQTLVNIFCQYKTEQYIRTITGSGFFINDAGVILTNAHVAQFLLLDETMGIGDTTCEIRTGNPATPAFMADLLYISPAWILQHANLIAADSPTGTGERDYALLYVTAGLNHTPIPGHLPYLVPNTELLSRRRTGSTVTLGGYPAEAAIRAGIPDQLPQRLATTTITELYTFGSNYADIFSLGGTPIGEHGVSGGPVVDEKQQVIGLISTRGNDTENGSGSLNAITISYIDRTMREETGFGLSESSAGDLPRRASIFRQTIVPFLKHELQREL